MVRRLLYLNGIAIFCVVVFHAVGVSFVAMFDWGPRLLENSIPAEVKLQSLNYWVLRIIEQIVVFSIPAFLFVSGYFVAAMTGRGRETFGWDLVWVRIKKLLIPYLIWSFVAMALLVVLDNRSPGLRTITVNLLTGRTNEVLYFVPLLVQYYLLSPFLVPIARDHWKVLLVVTGLIQLAVQSIIMISLLGIDATWVGRALAFLPKWLFIARLFWFTLGLVIGFHLETFKTWVYHLRWLLVGIILVSIPWGVLEWEWFYRTSGEVWIAYRETLVDSFYSLALILAFFAFPKLNLPFNRTIENLGKDSFGIFLIHIFFITYTGKLIYRFLPSLLAYELLLLVICSGFGLFGSLILMRIVSRTRARRFYSYLFG